MSSVRPQKRSNNADSTNLNRKRNFTSTITELNFLRYAHWSCKLGEYNLPSLSNLMTFLSIKDLVNRVVVNVADGDCWSLTCDHLSLSTKTDVIVNVGQCLNSTI